MTAQLPKRDWFTRRDVERLTRLAGRVLDYWEQEFGCLSPRAGVAGDKVYSRRDVEILCMIKQWLVVEHLEKREVRRRLTQIPLEMVSEALENASPKPNVSLRAVRAGLREILTILEKSDTN